MCIDPQNELTADRHSEAMEGYGPEPSTGNSLGSLWADVRGFWAGLPALIRMRFTRPWFVREQPARRKSDAHPDNVTRIDHYRQWMRSQELMDQLQKGRKP